MMNKEQSATAYALDTDYFVTVVYLSDYGDGFRTCVKVGNRYLFSSDYGHKNEHDARDVAATNTYVDNGRGNQVYSHRAAEWVSEGSTDTQDTRDTVARWEN